MIKAILIIVFYTLSIRPIPGMGETGCPQQPSQHPNANAASQPQSESGSTQNQQQEATPQNPPAPAPAPEQNAPAKPNAGTVPPQPEATPPQGSTASQSAPATSSSAPKKQKKKTKRRSKQKRIIVRNGGTSEPASQLAPGMPKDQAKRSRQSTNQLLSSSQENLKQASARTLNSSQQATVEQIKVFIEQANAALKVGDFQRGHNLAMKAHALSEDLLKQ